MEDASSVLLSREGGIARVVMNRPEQLNAIDVPMAARFAQVCQEVAADSSVRVVVISGSGRGFGAGGDLSAFREEPTQAAASIIEHVHVGLLQLTTMNAPVLASVHGVVAGGSLSLTSACDLAIAAEGTRFNLAYVNVAASCDVSGSWSLPRLVGLRNALQIALLGETFDAQEAYRLGLVNRVVPADQLADQTEQWVRKFAQGPTRALGRMKRLMRTSFNHDLPTQLELESQGFQDCTRDADFQEAMSAFFAKRKPQFQGR